MVGGAGSDTLYDRSADPVLFVYESLSDSTVVRPDRIVFGTQILADDKIDLSLIDADVAAPGDQAFHLADRRFSHEAGEIDLRVKSVPGGGYETYVLLDVDGDAMADAKIVLTGSHPHFDNFVF